MWWHKTKVDHAFQNECCMEIGYQIEEKINSKGGKLNYKIFRGMDNIFHLGFRCGDIWELINEIFDMWENIAIKNQKVKNSFTRFIWEYKNKWLNC